MELLGKILRTISLAILFGGSAAIVFAAICLVKAATAQGISAELAAAGNAPVFIAYSKVNLIAGICLLIGESLDYARRRFWSKLTAAQYASSLLCVASTMIFALGIVPSMERLAPLVKTDPSLHLEFRRLHESSRLVFSSTIALALISLILPVFGALSSADRSPDSP